MTWQPPPRPDWVRAVNAGDVSPIADVARLPFDRDALLDEARAELAIDGRGIDGFGDDDFLEPLSVLLPALEAEAELTILGRWITRRFLLRILQVRAHTVAYVRDDPAVRDEVIERPVFVTGAPRTGTTILHALLAQNPAGRVPEGWELLRPVPPPDPTSFPDPARVALADRELRMPALATGTLDTIHEYGGRMHKECVSSMSFVFRSEEFTARYHVPSYAALARHVRHDARVRLAPARPAGAPAPLHEHALGAEVARAPALAPHAAGRVSRRASRRSPIAIRSPCWARSPAWSQPCDGRTATTSTTPTSAATTSTSTTGARRPGRPRRERHARRRADVHHTHYAAFMADPFGTVASVADALDDPLDDADGRQRCTGISTIIRKERTASTTIRSTISASKPAEVRARFGRYQLSFDVPNEV